MKKEIVLNKGDRVRLFGYDSYGAKVENLKGYVIKTTSPDDILVDLDEGDQHYVLRSQCKKLKPKKKKEPRVIYVNEYHVDGFMGAFANKQSALDLGEGDEMYIGTFKFVEVKE